MTMILRPLLPLLLLIPMIALSGTVRAAVPIGRAATKPEAVRASLTAPATPQLLREQQAAVARLFTVSVQTCVRTGNRMVC